MTDERVKFRCPHCRREYSLVLDAEKLARLDRIVVCGRCRKKFSLGRRVREANSDPPPEEPYVHERDIRDAILRKREREQERREAAMRARAKRIEARRERDTRERFPPAIFVERDRGKVTNRAKELKPKRRSEPPPLPHAQPEGQRRSEPPPLPHAQPEGQRRVGPPPLPLAEAKAKATDREPQLEPSVTPRSPTLPPKHKPKTTLSPRKRKTTPPPRLGERITPVPGSQPKVTMPRRSSGPPTTPVPAAVEAPRRQRQTPAMGDGVERPEVLGAKPEAEGPVAKAKKKRRNTSPGLGGLMPSRPPSSSAPPPSSIPPSSEPPPDDDDLDWEPLAETEPPAATRPAIASTHPDGDESPYIVTERTESSEPPEDDDYELDEEEDDYEEEGDRPTLLLPDETMLDQVGKLPGPGTEDADEPPQQRNIAARVVMSRNDWIKLADPGLKSLRRAEGDDVRALAALLERVTP